MSVSDSQPPAETPPSPSAKTPTIVVWALVLSIAGFCGITAIVGIVLGFVGRGKAKEVGKGVGMSTAAIIIGVAWLVLGVIGVAIGSGNTDSEPSDSSEQVEVVEDDVVDDEPSAEEPMPEQEEELEPKVTEEPEPEPAEPMLEPESFEGNGDKIIQLSSGMPFVADINFQGDSNFAVWLLDGALNDADLLVNNIGNYTGTVLNPEDSMGGLKIEGQGSWSVDIRDVSSVEFFNSSISGQGDDVVFFDGSPNSIAKITNQGDSNFAVWLYSEDGTDLLVNEIGNYSGEQLLKRGWLEINSDGDWSIQVG